MRRRSTRFATNTDCPEHLCRGVSKRQGLRCRGLAEAALRKRPTQLLRNVSKVLESKQGRARQLCARLQVLPREGIILACAGCNHLLRELLFCAATNSSKTPWKLGKLPPDEGEIRTTSLPVFDRGDFEILNRSSHSCEVSTSLSGLGGSMHALDIDGRQHSWTKH